MFKKFFKAAAAVAMAAMCAVSAVSVNAATTPAGYDKNHKVNFSVTCNKKGYEFNVYKIADLSKGTNTIKYTSVITGGTNAQKSEISAAIKEGSNYDKWHDNAQNTATDTTKNQATKRLLDALDKLKNTDLPAPVGTYKSTDGDSKEFSNLPQGIYYVRAVNFPAGVKAVTNSVFALPYYTAEAGWSYTIDTIKLATKVLDKVPENHKKITNSTRNSEEYSDNSLGDTINYEVDTTIVGALSKDLGANEEIPTHEFPLNSYILKDVMSKGLTFKNDNTIKVEILDSTNKVIATLNKGTDYTVTATGGNGKETNITFAMTPAYLKKALFYKGDTVRYTYSGVVNEYAVIGPKGNPNTDVDLEYSNKTDVKGTVPGNTVWVYTWEAEVLKTDENGKNVLAGADFALYKTKAEATENDTTKAIGTGTTGTDGKLVFKNSEGKVCKVESGTYYARETKAPTGYNIYPDPVEIKITVTYNDEFNATVQSWVKDGPEIGKVTVGVKDSKVILPQTGGFGDTPMYLMGIVAAMMAGAIAVVFAVRKKRGNRA